MKNFIPAICFLWLCLIPVLCFSQDNEWVVGEWKGGYYGEKSKLTKKFDSRLQILKVYGTMFEGVVQCILPSDTTIRLHTRIAGRIYPNYLMTKLKEVVYFKDPPGQYTWAKHCFTCDSMKLTFVKRGDSIILSGERKCDTLCNIIARYAKSLAQIAYKAPAAKNASKGPTRYDLIMELAPPSNAPAPGMPAQGTTAGSNKVQQGAVQTAAPGKQQAQQATANGKPQVQQTTATGQPQIQQTTAPGKPQPQQPSPPVTNQVAATPTNNSTVQQTAAHSTTDNTISTAAQTTNGTSGNEPLGRLTPGIDRDNVYTASMPIRSGGNSITFARPLLRDSLTANNLIAGRNAVTSGRFVVDVDSAEVILMDNGWVDGDSVSLYYNGQVIVQKIGLSTKPFSIKIPVYRGGANLLTVYAESLGSIPPNTAYVRLICGKKETGFLLSSTMAKSSSIEIYRSEANSD